MQNYNSRSEIPIEYKWDLTDVFKTDEDFETEFAAVMSKLKDLDSFRGRLGESPKTLADLMDLSDDIGRRFSNLYVYSMHKTDQDKREAKYQEYSLKTQKAYSELMQAFSFVDPELISVGRETIDEFVSREPRLKLYEHALDDKLRRADYVLSEKEESLISGFGEVFSGAENAFSFLNNADLVFGSVETAPGKSEKITHANYSVFMRNRDREIRKNAYNTLYESYKAHNNTFASLLASQVKGDVLRAKARGFESSRHESLFNNAISDSIYKSLIEKINSRLDLMQRTLELRKKALGLDELRAYDLSVPLAKKADFNVPYEEAKAIVLEVVKPMGEDYVNTIKNAFDSRWIDVYETPGKSSGAYSGGSYDSNPYVLLNYQDELNDVFTLIHELGHSMHSHNSRKQPYVYSGYSMFLAEIASTFNENLLNHYLIGKETDPEKKLYLIDNYLNTIKGTIIRQTQFAEFEMNIHAYVESGGALTADYLNKEYARINRKYYPGVVFDEMASYEWSRIPHFYYNFYVFQYATGLSASISLSKKVLSGEAGAIEKYFDFLKAGSSDYSVEVLKKAGVDMEDGTAIDDAMDVYASYLDMLEEILEDK